MGGFSRSVAQKADEEAADGPLGGLPGDVKSPEATHAPVQPHEHSPVHADDPASIEDPGASSNDGPGSPWAADIEDPSTQL